MCYICRAKVQAIAMEKTSYMVDGHDNNHKTPQQVNGFNSARLDSQMKRFRRKRYNF